jgi:hypothetical protein
MTMVISKAGVTYIFAGVKLGLNVVAEFALGDLDVILRN